MRDSESKRAYDREYQRRPFQGGFGPTSRDLYRQRIVAVCRRFEDEDPIDAEGLDFAKPDRSGDVVAMSGEPPCGGGCPPWGCFRDNCWADGPPEEEEP